ncbi:DUF2157 domain-containing protein [Alloalcanivorax marinus]|uniref:DUF2157 domain-containing protein n=1 Tax=Alloalcanivorax marinus TaxID=1177169 RepID=UPI001931E8D7|nr:DUF2157 domain-containing protein [Alloalcanivorax marinus]MBL7249261.1 DUF2157 domain-containing protein [Alloalcanivorax marinus]
MRRYLIRRAIRNWYADGDIDEATARRLLARYGSALDERPPSAAGPVLAVAGLFLGLALLLVVSANWEQLPRGLRLAGLMSLTALLNGVGVARYLRHSAGAFWLLLGGFAYGASVMLIGQMYHLGEHFPNGLLLWALGGLPLALLTRSRLLALQTLAVAVAWMVMENRYGMPWAMPLFLVAAAGVARYRNSAVLTLATLAAAAGWGNLMLTWAYATDFGPDTAEGMISFNLALLVLAVALSRRPRWFGAAGPLLAVGVPRLVLLALLPFTFVDIWRDYLALAWTWLDPGLWAGLAVLVLAALAGQPLLAAVSAGLLALVHTGGLPHQALAWAVAVNLLVLALALGWLHRGLVEGQAGLFFTGLVAMLLLAALRYLDLIGGYLGAAGLFIAMATLLLLVAFYWRRREARS